MDNTTNVTVHSNSMEYPDWLDDVIIVYMLIILALGVPGNGCIIFIQTKLPRKVSTDYYIFAIALFDLICAGINAPMYIIQNVHTVWILFASKGYCCAHALLLYLTSMSSTLLLTAVAIDRYLVTCRPFSSIRQTWNSRAVHVSVSLSVVSVVYAMCTAFVHTYNSVTGICTMSDGASAIAGYFLSVILTIMFIVLFVIALVSYTRISISLRTRVTNIRRLKSGVSAHDNDFNSTKHNAKSDIHVPHSKDTVLQEHINHSNSDQHNSKLFQLNANVTMPTQEVRHSCETSQSQTRILSVPLYCLPSTSGNSTRNHGLIEQSVPRQFHQNYPKERHSGGCLSAPERTTLSRNALALPIKQITSTPLGVTRQQDYLATPNETNASFSLCDMGHLPNEENAHVQVRTMQIVNKSRTGEAPLTKKAFMRQKYSINRVTSIVCLLTIVHMTLWAMNWTASALETTSSGTSTQTARGLISLAEKLFMFNCLANPMVYVIMSSKFRKRVVDIFRKP